MDATGTRLARWRARTFSTPPALLRTAQRIVPQAWKDRVVEFMILADRGSRRRFRLAHGRSPGNPVAIRLRALGGTPIWIRPGTDDPWVVRELVTYGDHWPPVVDGPMNVIVDLGANIGLSMALFARRFPDARIIGVEPDPGNADLCRRNTAAWDERCVVVEGAIWTRDEPVELAGDSSSAFTLVSSEAGRTVPGVTIETLMKEHANGRVVDYMKVDVEGAERELLAAGEGWARVRCVSVEVHAPYDTESCGQDLRARGFTVQLRPASRGPRVVGTRRV
jgi:FkbM family methyltransferase